MNAKSDQILPTTKCLSEIGSTGGEKDGCHAIKMPCNNTHTKAETSVHSVAVIKKSQVEFPVSFRELQSNTDLKTPPSNWLRGQFSLCFPNLATKHSCFTSIIMGYQFPDCVGEVDIVSDAENIKKLLKMAYDSNTHLSMMVHRVGKSIFIDDFDICKYLLRRSECEWKWLRDFFYKHVLQSLTRKQHSVFLRPSKSRDVVQSKNLLSKFLYYSIEDQRAEMAIPHVAENKRPLSVRMIASPPKESLLEFPVEEHLPDPSAKSFTRNIIWNFEDLRMLIGTNLPIFGGRTHPCVSLRLSDMDKPISILTGIDYWLDNLMCNVPEVVMCYHQNGIVQKYELIKTEELPHMSESQFSPQLVRDIAHNILSFLKSKATKEGHTYWLFKGKDDDIVKLYDLTSLCNEDCAVNSTTSFKKNGGVSTHLDNPFTVPVAMLLFYVAKNMWNTKEGVDNFSSIRSLLDSVLNLLNKDKYPKIFVHTHLILADLYLSQCYNPESPYFSCVSEEELDITKTNRVKCGGISSNSKINAKQRKRVLKKTTECPSISLSTLCGRHSGNGSKHKKGNADSRFSRNVYERCNVAIDHVITALSFIDSHGLDANSTSGPNNKIPGKQYDLSTDSLDNEPKMAQPFQPIPMRYEPLNKSIPQDVNQLSNSQHKAAKDKLVYTAKRVDAKLQSVVEDGASQINSKVEYNVTRNAILNGAILNSLLKDASYIDKMRFLLLKKASLIYMSKARIELKSEKYGLCLRFVMLCLRSWCIMLKTLGPNVEMILLSQPFLLAGDAFYSISRVPELIPSYREEFNISTDELQRMNAILDNFSSEDESNWVMIPSNRDEAILLSYKSFEKAMEVATSNSDPDPDNELHRRFASISNELACIYMNEADQLCRTLGKGIASAGCLWEQSRHLLDKSLVLFREVEDCNNVVLMHCNKGRFLRLFAFHHSSVDGEQIFSSLVRDIYEEAFQMYEQALDILSSKSTVHVHVSESVFWEYSSALFVYGSFVQNSLQLEQHHDEELTKYLGNIYNKCLQLCESKYAGSKAPLYQYRAAIVHAKTAAIFHEKFRRSKDSKMMYLAEMHYQKSAAHFLNLDASPFDIFKVHLDYVKLLEDSIGDTRNHICEWKSYLSILKLLLSCKSALLLLKKEKNEKKKAETLELTRRKTGISKEKNDEINIDQSVTENDLKAILVIFEKKLRGSLLALLKLTKASYKSTECHGEQLKCMYEISLIRNNTDDFEEDLLQIVTSITPHAENISRHN